MQVRWHSVVNMRPHLVLLLPRYLADYDQYHLLKKLHEADYIKLARQLKLLPCRKTQLARCLLGFLFYRLNTIMEQELKYIIDEVKGVARQEPNTVTAQYDFDYYSKYRKYRGSKIANDLRNFRKWLVLKYCPKGLLDVGVGDLAFLDSLYYDGIHLFGTDINPVALTILEERGMEWTNDWESIDMVTFWDSLEHFQYPQEFLAEIPIGKLVCVSMPIIGDLTKLDESRHARLGEHLWLFTEMGFRNWMLEQGFETLDVLDGETQCGREDILTFVFRKVSNE
jgi:hypothetical protein